MKSLLFIITYYAFMFSKDKKIICSENHAIVHEVQKWGRLNWKGLEEITISS